MLSHKKRLILPVASVHTMLSRNVNLADPASSFGAYNAVSESEPG